MALEYAKLMTEQEYLRLEPGLGVATDEEDIEEQAEEAVEEGQEHDPASSQTLGAQPRLAADRTFRTPHACHGAAAGRSRTAREAAELS
jgi:hypothetical protein